MQLKKYISRKILVRVGLFLAIVAAAFVFDAYHQSNQKIADDVKDQPGSKDVQTGGVLFYSQLNSFGQKVQENESPSRSDFAARFNNLLFKDQSWHNSRALDPGLRICSCANQSFHYIIFNRIYHRSPDDKPPLV